MERQIRIMTGPTGLKMIAKELDNRYKGLYEQLKEGNKQAYNKQFKLDDFKDAIGKYFEKVRSNKPTRRKMRKNTHGKTI